MGIDLELIISYVDMANHAICSQDQAHMLIQHLDLTSLNESDNAETIDNLCVQAQTPFGNVAAVCIYPKFIQLAKKTLAGTNINIATVCNFPHGTDMKNTVLDNMQRCIRDGADEIDMVIPYQEYANQKTASTKALIHAAKEICGSKLLKVILEVGALSDLQMVYRASKDAIQAGADFLKTSTGKTPNAATPETSVAMLTAIKEASNWQELGFKAAGGIRTLNASAGYLTIAQDILGQSWVTPQHFRLGASKLLNIIIDYLL